MEKLNLEDVVLYVLKTNEKARKSDFTLIKEVIKLTNPEVRNMSFETVLDNNLEDKLPSFESITRARRKIFKKYPELNPTDIKALRELQEEEYKDWVRN